MAKSYRLLASVLLGYMLMLADPSIADSSISKPLPCRITEDIQNSKENFGLENPQIYKGLRVWMEGNRLVASVNEVQGYTYVPFQIDSIIDIKIATSNSIFVRGYQSNYFIKIHSYFKSKQNHVLVEYRVLPVLYYKCDLFSCYNSIYSYSSNLKGLFASGNTPLRESLFVDRQGQVIHLPMADLTYIGDLSSQNLAILLDIKSGIYFTFDGKKLLKMKSSVKLCS